LPFGVMLATTLTNLSGASEWEELVDSRYIAIGMFADGLTVDAHFGDDNEAVIHKNRSVVLVEEPGRLCACRS
jgi:hypothetical protein